MQIINIEHQHLKAFLLSNIIFLFSFSLFANVIDAKKNKLDDQTAKVRISSIDPEMYLPFTSETKRLLEVYTYSYLPGARRIVERSTPYFDQYDHLLIKKGLPTVLKNIGIVESNMDPWTYSSRGAAGVWQLMKNTARAYGLKIDGYVDERFDPLQASEVAFNYLKDLNEEFHDWNLTLIAYNFGPSALRKAIKHCGTAEYEVLKSALPKESKRYASRLAAAAYLSHYYSEHAKSKKPKMSAKNLAGIKVYEYISFDEITALTGLSKRDITKYNPAVIYDYLPANSNGYTIHLPIEKMMVVINAKGWDASQIRNFDYHKVKVESLIAFHSKYVQNVEENQNEEENEKTSYLESFFTLRREDILKMLTIG